MMQRKDENTLLHDELGNTVLLPAGFNVAEDSPLTIPEGVVVEDEKGNQYVWIAVGDIKKSDGTIVNIELNRYNFDLNGTATKMDEQIIEVNAMIDSYYVLSRYEEHEFSTEGNAVAENINGYIYSVNVNGGYFIGRYEIGTSDAGEYVVAGGITPTVGITQSEASRISKDLDEGTKMNNSNKNTKI